MLDLFHALAAIPELLIGAARYPKTIACLLLAAIVIMVGAVVVEESCRSEIAAAVAVERIRRELAQERLF